MDEYSHHHPMFLFVSSDSDTSLYKGKLKVEDVMPITTGYERGELKDEIEGRGLLDINHRVGPFGTKSINEKPKIIQEYESGKEIPNQEIITKLERALDVKLRGKK